MKKSSKIILSILAGIDVTLTIFTPIILTVLWVIVAELRDWNAYFFFIIGFLATIFRAIKVGWLKK